MRAAGCLLLSCLAAAAWAAPADAAVSVTFVHPEQYTDASLSGDYSGKASEEPVLRELRQHLERLGERHLAPDQTLRIEVTDIDLAGHREPWRAPSYDTRIVRGVTWPRIKLRYALEENGRVLASGEEAVADLNYLSRPAPYFSSEPLRYEKAMLDDWFRARIVERRKPRG